MITDGRDVDQQAVAIGAQQQRADEGSGRQAHLGGKAAERRRPAREIAARAHAEQVRNDESPR